jgi:hypothetical protein
VANHFRRVLIIHPTLVVQRLRDAGKVPDEWWSVFRTRQLETTEPKFEDLVKHRKKSGPIPIQVKRAKTAG